MYSPRRSAGAGLAPRLGPAGRGSRGSRGGLVPLTTLPQRVLPARASAARASRGATLRRLVLLLHLGPGEAEEEQVCTAVGLHSRSAVSHYLKLESVKSLNEKSLTYQ